MIYKFWKLKIVLLFFTTFLLYAPSTHAAFIFQRPLYLGLGSGLVGNWTFDGPDMAGITAYDRSPVGTNHGTLTGGPARALGAVGQALSFDGVDDKVTCGTGSSLNITGTVITISAWIYPKGWGGGNYGRIVDKINAGGAGYMFMIDNVDATGGIAFGINSVLLDGTDYGRTGSNALSLNIWQHVTVVYNGSGNLSFYVNGLNIPSIHNATASISDNVSVPCAIGGRNSDNSRLFDGLIDEVRVYDRALSASEIKRLYKIGGTTKINKPLYSGSLEDGLVGAWTFDGPDMAGVTAYDRSPVGTNHGTLTGGPTRALGKVGQALDFDGVDDWISMGTSLDISSVPFTVSAWVYPKSYAEWGQIFAKRDGYSASNMRFNVALGDADGMVTIQSYTSYITTTYSPPLNQWTHITVVPGSSTYLYVNGTLFNTYGSFTLGTDATAQVSIGATDNGASDPFNGLIDEVRVYNRALSAGEIKRLYKIGGTTKINKPTYSGSLTSGLVGNWTFDGPDMAGVTAYDRSPVGTNHGTLTGGPTRALGAVGQALSFDGSDDKVTVPGTATLRFFSSSFTTSAWVKLGSTAASNHDIIGNADSAYWFGTYGDEFFLGFSDTGGSGYTECRSSTANLDMSNFYHLVATFDDSANQIKLYLNGANVAAETAYGQGCSPTDNPDSDIGDVGIGFSAEGAGSEFFNGLIDEVRVYNRALSASEIKRLYEAGR